MVAIFHDMTFGLLNTVRRTWRSNGRQVINAHIYRDYAIKAERKEKRQKLIADFKSGSNFAHIREFQQSGGKRFHAPEQLIRKEDSVIFPDLSGKALTGRSISLSNEFPNHVTLLLMAMRGIAQPMCDMYRAAFQMSFEDTETAKCIEINAVDSWFYGLFRSFISLSLRKQVPGARQDNFMCYYGPLDELVQKALIGNMLVGHAFLVDREGCVRWKACAKPTDDELISMIKCTNLLRT